MKKEFKFNYTAIKIWLAVMWVHIVKKFRESFYPSWRNAKFTRRLNFFYKVNDIKHKAVRKHLTMVIK